MVEIRETKSDLRPALAALLDQQALSAGHKFDVQSICVEADANGTLSGGILAKVMLDRMYVEFLAVAPAARGQGVGTKLMCHIEWIARERGLKGVYLDTYSFQAPEFYQKIGYTEFGRLKGSDDGPERIYFEKWFPVENGK